MHFWMLFYFLKPGFWFVKKFEVKNYCENCLGCMSDIEVVELNMHEEMCPYYILPFLSNSHDAVRHQSSMGMK